MRPVPVTRLVALGLLVLVALFHGPALRNGFVYDDGWTLLDNPVVRSPSNLPALWGAQLARDGVPDAGRPLLLASEILDHLLWGTRAAGYHLQNVLWHAAVVLLLFVGLLRLTRDCALAGLAAALLAVHPLAVEVVAVINYREDLLATAWLLVGLIALQAARRVPGRLAGWGLRAAAFVAVAAACFAKESAYMAAIFLVLLDVWAAPPGERPTWRRLAPDWLLLGAAAAGVFTWRWWALGAPAIVSRTAELPGAHAEHAGHGGTLGVAGALTFARGLGQLIWPAGLAPEYPDPPTSGAAVLLGGAALALMALVLLLLPLLASWRRDRPGRLSAALAAPAGRWVAFGLALSVAAYLPHLGLVPLTNLRADRYFYLPLVGWSIAAAAAASALPARRWLPIALLLVAVLGVRTWRQGQVWRTDQTVFTAAVAAAPGVPRAWLGLASAELKAGRTMAALAAVERALALSDDGHGRELRGLVLMRQGALPAAREELLRALAAGEPGHRARVLNNLGYVELELGRLDEAAAHLAEARRLNPRFDRPWLNGARLQLQRGDRPGARRLLEELLSRVPESVDGWKQLARLAESEGRNDDARAAWRRARALGDDEGRSVGEGGGP